MEPNNPTQPPVFNPPTQQPQYQQPQYPQQPYYGMPQRKPQMGFVEAIKTVLIEKLKTIYHTRVSYPELKK